MAVAAAAVAAIAAAEAEVEAEVDMALLLAPRQILDVDPRRDGSGRGGVGVWGKGGSEE